MDGQKQETLNQNIHAKQMKESADEFLNEGKKFASDIYNDGVKKAEDVQKEALGYTEELLEQVRENPLTSVLIASGVGFLLSMLWKK